jgi:hypothetical protein
MERMLMGEVGCVHNGAIFTNRKTMAWFVSFVFVVTVDGDDLGLKLRA